MSKPRQVLPGKFWSITRRCTQRQFLLRPCEMVDQVFMYTLAAAAARTGVIILAYVVMSNHYHLVVYDPDGRVPEFVEHHNKLSARALNAHWGRRENFYASGRCNMTELVTEEDVIDKIVYCLCNPVKAFLVDSPAQWPGVTSWNQLNGKSVKVLRPSIFFRGEGSAFPSTAPDEVTLTLSQPSFSIERRETFQQWAETIRERALKRTKEIRAAEPKRGIVGRKAILAQSELETPNTVEPPRKLNPSIACKNKILRIEARLRLRGFHAQYQEAYTKMRDGKAATFPHGTYRLVRLGVPIKVASAPKLVSKTA
jgi:putative transposase